MQIPNIQNSKFTPGPLPEICAPRERLLTLLSAAAALRRVYISAPAGSGKTVSAILWVEASGRRPVWVGLDSFDDSAAVFYRLFCTGMLSAQPDNERIADLLRSPGFDSSPVEHTINLLSAFRMDENTYALTLDDFHNIRNPEILKSLPYILRRVPHSFVILILSRAEPPEHFARLIEQGHGALIGAGELTFSAEETREYFESLGKSTEEANSAHIFAGGWAIGVNALGHSALTAQGDFGGQNLTRYIEEYIWAEWDKDLRSFMISSAAVDEMPVNLCEKITGRADAGIILEGLRAENVFVTRSSDGVYRYHHLFLDFLRARPEYALSEKHLSWSLAAEYYLSADDILAARRYAYISGDEKMMAAALYAFAQNRGVSISEYLGFSREFFLSRPPGEMISVCEKYPPLYVGYIYTAYLCGEKDTFEHAEDQLRRHAPKILLKYPHFAELLMTLIALDYRTPFAKQIRQAALLPPIRFSGEALRAATMSFQMPFMHRSSRDYHELADRRLLPKLQKTFGRLLKNHYELIMHGLYSGLLLEQNRTGEALAEAQACVLLLDGRAVREMRFAAEMHLAAACLALGRESEFNEQLEKTERFVENEAGFLRPNFLAFTTRVKLWNGDTAAAREWLDRYFVTDSPPLEAWRVYQYFTTARAYAVLGELERARELAGRLRQFGKDFRRPLDAAEGGILLAVVLWAAGKKKDAQIMLEEVMQEMQPSGFVRLIADEGAAVEPILKKSLRGLDSSDRGGGLDRVYVNTVYLATYAVSKRRAGLTSSLKSAPVKLSRQQKKILTLLSKGYNREAIIEMTGLTLNTVKTHTRLAYGKLGANSAAEAVLKARELGVIE
ncbi:MAG: LuxR C-terminal-related transcriptional regulator [Oscillospiraceae bacterium]|jgi:LuxR family maltose regulon positive regulatory protein|nr:LuxR C-terminal-related transcriptional regulator [Oscillospiraceae bacterium]